MSEVQFPPLFQGEAVAGASDPFDRATALSIKGTNPGTVVHNLSGDTLQASLIFAPEVPLEQAMVSLPICGLGFQAALGALAPPEVAVHLGWDGAIRVNGAVCGRFRTRASTTNPSDTPLWLVVGLELNMVSPVDNPGEAHDITWLSEEGCGEITPEAFLESWVRHTLYWVNRWVEDGPRPIHTDWRALIQEIGEDIEIDGQEGTFMGLDETFGMLLRAGSDTLLIPLSSRLES